MWLNGGCDAPPTFPVAPLAFESLALPQVYTFFWWTLYGYTEIARLIRLAHEQIFIESESENKESILLLYYCAWWFQCLGVHLSVSFISTVRCYIKVFSSWILTEQRYDMVARSPVQPGVCWGMTEQGVTTPRVIITWPAAVITHHLTQYPGQDPSTCDNPYSICHKDLSMWNITGSIHALLANGTIKRTSIS